MKKLLILPIIAIIVYSVYFDITIGTLPTNSSSMPTIQEKKTDSEIPFRMISIQPGDTLLSIMEREEGQLSKPIENILKDFQELNNGTSPHELKIGESYKFPTYMKLTD